jgi:hypothetical protein
MCLHQTRLFAWLFDLSMRQASFVPYLQRSMGAGVLIEAPVMLSVVKIVNSTCGWYEAGARVEQRAAPEKAEV